MGDLWVVLRLAEEQCVFIQTDKTHNVFFCCCGCVGRERRSEKDRMA